MTQFLQDILRQPAELQRSLEHLRGACGDTLEAAAESIRDARQVFLTGIGASWNASLGAGALFRAAGRPVYQIDASELLISALIPRGSIIVILSRSGDSVEIMKLIAKARDAHATVVGITNFAEGNLARLSDFPIVLPVAPDHGISANTYGTLALAAGILCAKVAGEHSVELEAALAEGIARAEQSFPRWQAQLADTAWLQPSAPYYFLARGSSLASAHESRLLWEEGVKSPATAMGAGSFRHGPQEIVTSGLRLAIWIDAATKVQDLALARDLGHLSAHVLLIGHDIPEDAAELVFEVPSMPAGWQFLVDIFPVQLAAERLSVLSGNDCDSFRLASYIVRDDAGLGLRVTPSPTPFEESVP
jgi:glucosamine--fructose-6-phosphate aminotransferase (isomerizing)